jgi:hypothetical protein
MDVVKMRSRERGWWLLCFDRPAGREDGRYHDKPDHRDVQLQVSHHFSSLRVIDNLFIRSIPIG